MRSKDEGYSTNQLGATSEDAAALISFFEEDPEEREPAYSVFEEHDQALLHARMHFVILAWVGCAKLL